MAKRTRAPGTQQPELPADLDDEGAGITYADEVPDEVGVDPDDEDEVGVEPPEVAAPLEPAMNAPPDPEQAKAVIAEMRRKALLRQSQGSVAAPPPVLPSAKAEEVRQRQPRLFRVLETLTLPQGASSRRFPAGKVIDDNQYNVEELAMRGLKLEEYTPSGRPEARR